MKRSKLAQISSKREVAGETLAIISSHPRSLPFPRFKPMTINNNSIIISNINHINVAVEAAVVVMITKEVEVAMITIIKVEVAIEVVAEVMITRVEAATDKAVVLNNINKSALWENYNRTPMSL